MKEQLINKQKIFDHVTERYKALKSIKKTLTKAQFRESIQGYVTDENRDIVNSIIKYIYGNP